MQNLVVNTRTLEITPDNTGLQHGVVSALFSLGYDTVERLREALVAASEDFQPFLAINEAQITELVNRLKLLGDGLEEDLSKDLSALPCPLGLSAEVQAGEPEANSADLMKDGFEQAKSTSVALCNLVGLPIRDQGDRQTCVAHSLIRCYEYQQAFRNAYTDLSEQFLHWTTKDRDGLDTTDTTTLEAGRSALEQQGACEERLLPYVQTKYENDPRQRGPQPTQEQFDNALHFKGQRSRSIDAKDVDAIKMCIQQKMPVAFGLASFDSWKKSQSVRRDGRIPLPPPGAQQKGGHAVTLVGFVDHPSFAGGGYFIFDNSWGETWGIEGQHGEGRGLLPYRFVTSKGFTATVLQHGALNNAR
jgi:C1A family cysteine protease